MAHYIPMWFYIRLHSSCETGPQNLMRSIELLRFLPKKLQDYVRPVLQRNAYWAHPEAVLLAMVADSNPEVRDQAVTTIMHCRQQQHTENVRPYLLPSLNFEAGSYTELLDWEEELITEPPLTLALSDAELEGVRLAPLAVPHFPVHTVSVERTVRVVTEAAANVVGERQRHGFICGRLRHREKLPSVKSKKNFH